MPVGQRSYTLPTLLNVMVTGDEVTDKTLSKTGTLIMVSFTLFTVTGMAASIHPPVCPRLSVLKIIIPCPLAPLALAAITYPPSDAGLTEPPKTEDPPKTFTHSKLPMLSVFISTPPKVIQYPPIIKPLSGVSSTDCATDGIGSKYSFIQS